MSENILFSPLSLVFDGLTSPSQPVTQDSSLAEDANELALNALYELIGPSGGRIRDLFHRMKLAEDVIEQLKRLNPHKAELIHMSFCLMCATPVLEEAPERLYIAHCQELAHRVAEGEDTRAATMSELIAAIHGVSLITPVKRYVIYLYWELFQLVFPEEASTLFKDKDQAPIVADEWDKQQAAELRAGLSRELTIPNRVLKSSL